jgi:cysteinyl-tRNA synthetase
VRHHDYTIAVAEAVSGKKFAEYWFHCHHLFIDGKKMSKSKGNVLHPRDLLKRGYKGEHIRFFLAYGHYRKRLNFTFQRFAKTSQILDAIRLHTNNLGSTTGYKSSIEAKQLVERMITSFEKHLNDDLHVEKAIDELATTLIQLNKLRQQGQLSVQDASRASENLKKIDQVLQVIF